MKTVNIEGILFSEEGIKFVKEWIAKPSEIDNTMIENNIAAIERTQSFLLKNWDTLEDNSKMKVLLTGLQSIKENLSEFAVSISVEQKGGRV
ncbi:MAG: hypothetical protein Q7J05_04070 [Paludibacter sp.]|jgi:hypothetical protein|nr:hypothetical protein [Paludibacter sp.]